MAQTHNGDFAYEHTGDNLVEFFSKAGSLFKNRGCHYGNPVDIMSLFIPAWKTNKYKSMQLAMWLRDCRNTNGRCGSGNRSGGREVFQFIATVDPSWIIANICLIPEVGRWDDLTVLFGTHCEEWAVRYWASAIKEGNGLAAKWAPREKSNKLVYHKLRKALKLSPGEFRKLLAKNTEVVEKHMCSNRWGDIDYNHVPSVAMARSVNAFTKHDTDRFSQWKQSLSDPKSGNAIHAGVLFPHDCIRTLKAELSSEFKDGFFSWSRAKRVGDTEVYQESEIANAQFAALPNYMEGTNAKIMTICDFSGSMNVPVSGNIHANDIAMGLGLYCSDRLGKDNPFYRMFIPFSDDARFVNWKDESFSVAVQKHNDGFGVNTNVVAALDLILGSAQMFKASNEQMPTCLLIVSDMEFDFSGGHEATAIESCMKKWEQLGYNRPNIVYWQLGDYGTSPAIADHKNVALVSGFSSSILTAILSGDDFSPRGVMERAISKYEIVSPL
jgi:hypothetical protein